MLDICIKTETLTVGQIIKALELYDKNAEVRIQRTGEGGRIIQMSNTHAQIMNEMDPGDKAVTIWLHDDKRIGHEEKDSVRPDPADEVISSVNLEVRISTPEDIERLRKLCDELQQSISSQEATPEKRGTYSDDSFLSLSGKELKELINKWIVYHAENDINLSPGYFERLLRGWETIYRRQCGMSMLDTF